MQQKERMDKLSERTVDAALYLIENKSTIRETAKQFGCSKSAIHSDLSKRLKQENPGLYAQVKEILDWNLAERHIRGGRATGEKLRGTKKK